MFYTESLLSVLLNFCGRKDARHINKQFTAHSMCTAQYHMDMAAVLATGTHHSTIWASKCNICKT